MDEDLASCLRAWRDRVDPIEVGLPRQALRRAAGLRREEVAALAGVSVNYLTRLEQGRARRPSVGVVVGLARALRLTSDEAAHLHRVAGHAPPASGQMARHLTPSVQRILDRLTDVPVVVLDPAWTVVAQNAMAAALIGDLSSARGRRRNVIWQHFTGAPTRAVRTPGEVDFLEKGGVAELHAAFRRYPEDEDLRSLVADLRAKSARFEHLWNERPTGSATAARKTFEHPEAGRLTLYCDVLTVEGSDLRLVVYTATPGSPDASTLELIGVLGLERFGTRPASAALEDVP